MASGRRALLARAASFVGAAVALPGGLRPAAARYYAVVITAGGSITGSNWSYVNRTGATQYFKTVQDFNRAVGREALRELGRHIEIVEHAAVLRRSVWVPR